MWFIPLTTKLYCHMEHEWLKRHATQIETMKEGLLEYNCKCYQRADHEYINGTRE